MGKQRKTPKYRRSDVPYVQRMGMVTVAQQIAIRQDATRISMKVAEVALNEVYHFGPKRVEPFLLAFTELFEEYYNDTETGEIRLDRRIEQIWERAGRAGELEV